MTEFFIIRKYREGIGKSIVWQISNLHKGKWEEYQKERNKTAQLFWNKVIMNMQKGILQNVLRMGEEYRIL